MFKWINSTPIFLRLFLAFAWATIIPAVIIVIVSDTYFQSLDAAGQAVQTSNQSIKITTTELAHLQSMHALLVALLPSITINSGQNQALSKTEQNVIFQVLSIEGSFDVNTVKYQAQYQLATAKPMTDMRNILLRNDTGSSALISQQQTLLNNILEHQWPQYKAAQDVMLVGLYTRIPLAQAAVLLQKADALYAPLLASWQQVVNIAEQVNTVTVKVGPQQTNPILIATFVAIIGSMIIVFGIGSFANMTITRPLRQLIDLTKRVVAGETTARARVSGNDEIARVALSMNTMLDNIVQLMQETRFQRDGLQSQVEKLIEEVKGIAEGNLRARAEVTNSSLGMLASSSNYMLNELENLVVRIKKVAHEVDLVAMAILEQMGKPLKMGNVQIQQVVEATAGVEQMALVSYETANQAQKLHAITNDAQRNVDSGHQAVWEAVNEISRIQENMRANVGKVQALGERSQEINNIAEVIAGIAYQTNRLALDSAIQAALAGDNGKGFAPIAANIRRLAEQTKNQAGLIARIVRNVRDDIAVAATSMQETERETQLEGKVIQDVSKALEVIFTGVERQSQEVSNINQMATQHWQSSNRIVQIMHHISDTTQRNNANIEAATQHMQRLSQVVEQLRVSVGAFKLLSDPSDSGKLLPSALSEMSTGDWPRFDSSSSFPHDMTPSNPLSSASVRNRRPSQAERK